MNGIDVERRHDPELLEQPQLFHAHRRLGLQQRDLRLPSGHLRLAHVDKRCLPDGVPRLGELQELLVAVQLLARDLGVLPGLQHREVLLRHGRHQVPRRARDVRFGRVVLRAFEPGLRERRPRQLPVEAEAVARGQGGDVLREIGGQKPLLARAAVADPARGGHRRQQQARKRVAHSPRRRPTIVEGLAVIRVVLTSDGDCIGQRKRGGDRLLGYHEGRADDEPDGHQHVSHVLP